MPVYAVNRCTTVYVRNNSSVHCTVGVCRGFNVNCLDCLIFLAKLFSPAVFVSIFMLFSEWGKTVLCVYKYIVSLELVWYFNFFFFCGSQTSGSSDGQIVLILNWRALSGLFLYYVSKGATPKHTQLCGGKLCANEIHITVGHWIHFRNGNWYNLPRDLLWVVGHIYSVTLTPQCGLRNTFTLYQPINSSLFVPSRQYGLDCSSS